MFVWVIWKLGVGKNGFVVSPSHPSIQEVVALWTFVASIALLSLCHSSLLPHFCIYVSSFPQGGSPPSQVTLEQIPQRRAIPTNTPTMSLWSVTSLLILRGQSSVMWRMTPCPRAVGTQVGTYTVDSACLIQCLLPRKRNWGKSEMFAIQY